MSPSALVQKYGYKEILQPVLDDILTLETTGIEINLGSQEHTFLGTVSIAVAAHALGRFYCNFSTVDRFCRFCNCTRDQLHGMLNLVTFLKELRLATIITPLTLKHTQKCLQFMELNKGHALILSNIIM